MTTAPRDIEIDLAELKRYICGHIDYLIEERDIAKIAIHEDDDWYWTLGGDSYIPVESATCPEGITIGSIGETWELMQGELRERDFCLPLLLYKAAAILRYIGHRYPA